jgi:hypothetical protein
MAKTRLKRGPWTKADLQILRKMFANASTAAVAKKLGRPLEAVKKKASRMGMVKSKKRMKLLGRS